MMEKICFNCKYCSYHKAKKELDNMNWFKKFFVLFPIADPEYNLEFQKEYCRCLHPNVFKRTKGRELVSGNLSNERIFCSTARFSSSFEASDYIYNCCGVEGKYFELKED